MNWIVFFVFAGAIIRNNTPLALLALNIEMLDFAMKILEALK